MMTGDGSVAGAVRPMRVLLVDPGGELGGAEVLLDSIARSLDPAQAVPILACLQPGSWPDQMLADGLDVRVLPRARFRDVATTARVMARLTRIARDEKVDLVHANGNSALLYASVAARAAGTRLVWHLHDPQSAMGGRRQMLLWFLRRSRPDYLIFSSPPPAASWLRIWGSRHPPASTIIPDVDMRALGRGDERRARLKFGLAADAPVIAMLARPVAYKGHEDLVRAAAIIGSHRPAVRVVIPTGLSQDEALRGSLQRLAVELGAGETLCFPTRFDDSEKADLLAACFVLAHPAWREPFGLAMLEAMAAGRPVVAAESDGSRYLVEQGVTGLLVPPRDPGRLADALLELLENPSRARDMGEAGRRRAFEISDGRMVERIVDIWKSVLDGNRGSARP